MYVDIPLARERVAYDPETGIFTWLVNNRGSTKAGDPAGTTTKDGRRFVKINQRKYLAHQLAWALFYNEQPPSEIDHKDRDQSNNAIFNLRAATRQQNCQNRGFDGVRFEADRNRWLARITLDGKEKNLGRFKTKEEALAARVAAEKMLFGEFARVR